MTLYTYRTATISASLAIACLLAIMSASKADEPTNKEVDVHDFAAKDHRLLKKVNVVKMHVALGELLQAVSSQSHIKIRMDAATQSSGADVSVGLKNVAVAEILASLQSLFSHKQGPWRWERSGSEENFEYTFMETPAARAFASKHRNHEQTMFEQQADLLIRLAFMTPPERQQHTQELAACLGLDDQSMARAVLRESEAAVHMWSGLRMFDQSLLPEQKYSVIHDHLSIKLPVDRLSNSNLQFVQKLAAGNTHDVDGVAQPIRPQWVEFAVEPRNGASARGPHALAIMLDGIGGSSYAGAGLTSAGLSRQLYKAWILPKDAATDLIEDIKMSAPQIPVPEDKQAVASPGEFGAASASGRVPTRAENRARAEHRITEAANAAPFSYIARLPFRTIPDTGQPYGQTVAEFLRKYEGMFPQLLHKWHDHVLLLTYPDWPFEEQDNVSYSTTTQLRSDCNKGRGYLPLRTLVELSSLLSPGQVDRASTEFPVLKALEVFRPVFRLITMYPQMLQPDGAAIDSSLAQQLAAVPAFANHRLLTVGGGRAVRLCVYEQTSVQNRKWEARVELLNERGNWIPVAGLLQRPHAEVDVTK